MGTGCSFMQFSWHRSCVWRPFTVRKRWAPWTWSDRAWSRGVNCRRLLIMIQHVMFVPRYLGVVPQPNYYIYIYIYMKCDRCIYIYTYTYIDWFVSNLNISTMFFYEMGRCKITWSPVIFMKRMAIQQSVRKEPCPCGSARDHWDIDFGLGSFTSACWTVVVLSKYD